MHNMIIAHAYKSDNNKLLKDSQHDLYEKHVFKIFEAAKLKLIQADSILNANFLITKKARDIDSFDHRILQNAHDIIAAAYRYRYDDGGQLNLFRRDITIQDYYKIEWARWFYKELDSLLDYSRFVRAVVECVVYSNTNLGYDAEHSVCDVLISHYGMEDWGFPDGYVKTYK